MMSLQYLAEICGSFMKFSACSIQVVHCLAIPTRKTGNSVIPDSVVDAILP
jgi:hypothetical protein